jgi:hypothetical protein
MAKFKLYSCKLRLDGSVLNEVPKYEVTAAEIEMLRGLHGSDAIINIKDAGSVERSDAEERARVYSMFINPLLDAPPRVKAKNEMFSTLFGHKSQPMPKTLEADETIEDIVDEKPVAPPIRRTRATQAASFAE